MANGELVQELKACLESEGSIPRKTLDRLQLRLMMQLYEKINDIEKAFRADTETIKKEFNGKFEKLRPAMTTYKVVIWAAAIAGTAIISGLITGKLQLVIIP